MAQEERPSVFKETDIDNALEKVDLSRVAAGVRRRLWIPILFGICAALGFGVLSQHMLKKWNAEVLLLYRAANTNLDVPGMKGGFSVGYFSMPTMVDMISLPTHFQAVKSILGLESSTIDLEGMVRVEVPNRQADIIKIVCTADAPGLAIDVANTLASVAVKQSQSIRANQLQIARDYFRNQADVAQDRLSRQLGELAQFKKEHDFIQVTTDGTSTLRGLETAEDRMRESKLDYETLLVEYENLRREVGKIPDHIVKEAYENDPIKVRIGQTELALLQARTRFSEENPKIKVLENELSELRLMVTQGSFKDASERTYIKNTIKDSLKIELVRLQGKLRSAQKRKEEGELVLLQLHQELSSLPEEQMQFVRMLHQKTLLEAELNMSEEAIRSADLLISLGRGDVELYQVAEEADPNESMILTFLPLLGLGVGLILGLVTAFLLEIADKRLRTGREIGLSYSAPCLQVVPELSRLNPRSSEQKTKFFIRNISDRLSYIEGDKATRSILLTSGTNGEGKSTIAWHLALYSRTVGKKVCYLQFDYHPNVYLPGEQTQKSVNDYLRGECSIDEIIARGDVDCIHSVWTDDLKELIRSNASEQLFEALYKRYDLLVVDGPGIIDDDYAVNLCRRVDSVLFVIGSSQSKRRVVDTALQELQDNGISLAGIILNRVKKSYCDDPRLNAARKRSRSSWTWKT